MDDLRRWPVRPARSPGASTGPGAGTKCFALIDSIKRGKVFVADIPFARSDRQAGMSRVQPGADLAAVTEWGVGCSNPLAGKGDDEIRYKGHSEPFTLDRARELAGGLGDRVLVACGFYMPHLADVSMVGGDCLATQALGVQLAEHCHSLGRTTDLLTCVIDLNLGGDGAQSSANRRALYADYALPVNLRDGFLALRQRQSARLFVVSERKLNDKFQRDRRRFVREGKIVKGLGGEPDCYYIDHADESFLVASTQPDRPDSSFLKCMASCGRLIELTRELGYDGLVRILPVCGRHTAEPGRMVHDALYGAFPVATIYATATCYR